MRVFQGRVVTPGTVTANAVVTTQGFNTLASLQMALQFGDKEVKCSDQNNSEIHGKSMLNKALCLPQTIGSTTGGLVLYCACALEKNPACMLFSNHIDSLAAAGAVLAEVWVDKVTMPVIDSLGDEEFSASMGRYLDAACSAVLIHENKTIKDIVKCLEDYKARAEYMQLLEEFKQSMPEEYQELIDDDLTALEELNEYRDVKVGNKKTGEVEVSGTSSSKIAGILL